MKKKSEQEFHARSFSPDLWRRIDKVIQDAKGLEQRTVNLLGEIEISCLQNVDRAAILLNDFCSQNIYKVVCGEFKFEEDHYRSSNAADSIVLFFHCIKAIALEQFRGFGIIEGKSAEFILEHTFRDGRCDQRFWNPVVSSGKPSGEKPIFEQPQGVRMRSRRYILFSLYRALSRVVGKENKFFEKSEGLRDAVLPLLRKQQDSPPEEPAEKYPYGSHGFNRRYLAKLHTFEMIKLREISIPERVDWSEWDGKLFHELERLLQRGKEQTVALEISLLLRVMGGRYLNGAPKCEPRWAASFGDAVDYVLSKQSRSSGRWVDELIESQPRNPLVHGVSPLVYILDLGNDVLSPRLPSLVRAAEKAIVGQRSLLEAYFPTGWAGSQSENRLDARDLLSVVVGGLSLGALAYDRFKDLLSDSILNSQGATVPETDYSWEAVPESLGFMRNLEEGVVERWSTGSTRRPGAVLIYGPPGTGKTTIAKLLAERLNELQEARSSDVKWRFLELTPADFARKGADRIVACAEEIFTQLKRVRRCVVLMDEMEEFLRVRDEAADKESRLITTAFLPLLQEVVRSREIILVVATNFVGSIDPAMTRRGRFDLMLPLGPPDRSSRKKLIENLDSINTALEIVEENYQICKKHFLEVILEYTMGYSGSELVDFAHDLSERVRACHYLFKSTSNLVIELWRMRAERVPTALSGRAGCNWKTFSDEARRFARWAVTPGKNSPGASDEDERYWEEYWKEPNMPDPWRRNPLSVNENAASSSDPT